MNYFAILGLITLTYMCVWFAISVWKKRNDVADIAWGMGFPLIAWSSFLIANKASVVALVTNILVSIWGARLASHIWSRNKNKPEDARYAQWRKDWKNSFFIKSFVNVFLLQGGLMYLIALPVMLNNLLGGDINLIGILGILIWIKGFAFEVIGDWQLTQHIKNPNNKGKLMTRGLWRYTRHPNYFGEITCWWGFYVFTLFTPFWYLGIIGPITITLLILGVSGIPMLEKHYEGNQEYDAYKKTTSAFFPLPPKL
jgi:steroid 5-alpha reductase family enzyme